MKYKCVFSDIDGTLLNCINKINEETKAKVKELKDEGVPFVLVSARMPKGMDFLQEELGIKAPMICYSGGLLVDENQKPLYSKGFKLEVAKSIAEYVEEHYGVAVSLYYDNHWAVTKVDAGIEEETSITGLIPETLDYAAIEQVHKILIIADPAIVEKLEVELKDKYKGLNIYKSKPNYLEIMDEGVLKSNAIKELCKILDIDIKDTVSFGDNYNDVDMLNATGIGFAMGNAPDGVKRQVKHLTLTNNQNGIVYALNFLV